MKAEEFGKYIKELRAKRELTIRQLEIYSGVSNSYLSQLENGKRGIPSPEILKKLSKGLKVPYDELMIKAGYLEEKAENNSLPKLTPKDERDIKKDLESIINNLENQGDGYASFDGQTLDDMDDEERELLINALEQSMKIAKQIAKKKYTPKKYRKED
ncbi:helix-turn-helix transcriptional regulator [Caldifermentibacillus hisashii]|uniref:helix-turn-helix domain-containing protein n=1 Tax=Caldifermentibacillus hisashii TaxID=996558 RepID=UPI0031FDB294